MVGGNFARFFDPALVCVFVLAWWDSDGACEKDAAGRGWMPVCTGVGCLVEVGVGSPSADEAENPSCCPKGHCVKLLASREVPSGSLCLWITEKEPQAFFPKACTLCPAQ